MRLCAAALAMAAVLAAQTPKTMTKAQVPTGARAGSPRVDPNEVALTIGERKFTAAQYEMLVHTLLPPEQQAYALGPGRRATAMALVAMFTLAGEAEKQKLDERPDLATKLDYQAESVLESAMFRKLTDSAVVPEADIQAYYDAHKADYEVVTARQILIRVKGSPLAAVAGRPELSDADALAKAESIRKRLVAGGNFAAIAKAESDDISSAAKGGELGEIKRGKTVPTFEKAAFSLKPGDISEPVRSPYGYHIIQVASRSFRPLAAVKQDILAQLKPGIARKEAAALVDGSEVHIDDGFFGPEPAAVAGATGK